MMAGWPELGGFGAVCRLTIATKHATFPPSLQSKQDVLSWFLIVARLHAA
jgi:hypothetical protein